MSLSLIIPAVVLPIAGLCSYIPLRSQEKFKPALAVKTVMSILFIVYSLFSAVILAGKDVTSAGQVLISKNSLIMILCVVAGQVCGLLGDIWLDQKDSHPESKKYYMYCGFSAFLVGHFFFLAGLNSVFAFDTRVVLIALAAGVAMALFMFFLEKPMKLAYGEFRPVLLIYTVVLTATMVLPILLMFPAMSGDVSVAQAAFTVGSLTLNTVPAVFALGLLLFFLSDLVLSQIYFNVAKEKAKPAQIAVNITLYYVAQYVLAASLYFLK
ncbi:MAG: lysoplasmalogenase [Clostridium sp.]|nr:lysoplasmalogenase [Clostridium sp.]